MQMRQLMDGKYSNEMVLITEPAEERDIIEAMF